MEPPTAAQIMAKIEEERNKERQEWTTKQHFLCEDYKQQLVRGITESRYDFYHDHNNVYRDYLTFSMNKGLLAKFRYPNDHCGTKDVVQKDVMAMINRDPEPRVRIESYGHSPEHVYLYRDNN